MEWLSQHPEAIVSISSAIVSAAVALIVVILSHWTTSKRERIEHLISKLEELYLLLNKTGELNLDNCNIILRGQNAPKKVMTQLQSLDDVYCLKLHKKIVMYVRLYFPRLTHTHQKLFQSQLQLNKLVFNFLSSGNLPLPDIIETSRDVGKHLQTIEKEIIDNWPVLVGKRSILKFYKRAT